jgi:hypothetical protein
MATAAKRKRTPFGSSQHGNIQRARPLSNKVPTKGGIQKSYPPASENGTESAIKFSVAKVEVEAARTISHRSKPHVRDNKKSGENGKAKLGQRKVKNSLLEKGLSEDSAADTGHKFKARAKKNGKDKENQPTESVSVPSRQKDGERTYIRSQHDADTYIVGQKKNESVLPLQSSSPFDVNLSLDDTSPNTARQSRPCAINDLVSLQKKLAFKPRNGHSNEASDRRSTLERYLDSPDSPTHFLTTSGSLSTKEAEAHINVHGESMTRPTPMSASQLRQLRESPADDPQAIEALLKSTVKSSKDTEAAALRGTNLPKSGLDECPHLFQTESELIAKSRQLLGSIIEVKGVSDDDSVLTLDSFLKSPQLLQNRKVQPKYNGKASEQPSNSKTRERNNTYKNPSRKTKMTLPVVKECLKESDSAESQETDLWVVSAEKGRIKTKVLRSRPPPPVAKAQEVSTETLGRRPTTKTVKEAACQNKKSTLLEKKAKKKCDRDRHAQLTSAGEGEENAQVHCSKGEMEGSGRKDLVEGEVKVLSRTMKQESIKFRQPIPLETEGQPAQDEQQENASWEEVPLPLGWILKRSAKTQRTYYVHVGYGSTWYHPLDKGAAVSSSAINLNIPESLRRDHYSSNFGQKDSDGSSHTSQPKSAALLPCENLFARLSCANLPLDGGPSESPLVDEDDDIIPTCDYCSDEDSGDVQRATSYDEKQERRDEEEEKAKIKRPSVSDASNAASREVAKARSTNARQRCDTGKQRKRPSHPTCSLQQLCLAPVVPSNTRETAHAVESQSGHSILSNPKNQRQKIEDDHENSSILSFLAQSKKPHRTTYLNLRRRRKKTL